MPDGTQGDVNQRLDQLNSQLAKAFQHVGSRLDQIQQVAAAPTIVPPQPQQAQPDPGSVRERLLEEFARDPLRYQATNNQIVQNTIRSEMGQALAQLAQEQQTTFDQKLYWTRFWDQHPDLQPWHPMVQQFFMASNEPDPQARAAQAAAATRNLVFSQSDAIQNARNEEEVRRRMAGSPAFGGNAGQFAPVDAKTRLESMHAAVDDFKSLQKQRMWRNWKMGGSTSPA